MTKGKAIFHYLHFIKENPPTKKAAQCSFASQFSLFITKPVVSVAFDSIRNMCQLASFVEYNTGYLFGMPSMPWLA